MSDDQEGKLLPFKKTVRQAVESKDPLDTLLAAYAMVCNEPEAVKKLIESVEITRLRELFLRIIDENFSMRARLDLMDHAAGQVKPLGQHIPGHCPVSMDDIDHREVRERSQEEQAASDKGLKVKCHNCGEWVMEPEEHYSDHDPVSGYFTCAPKKIVWWQPGEYVALGYGLTVIAADSSRARAKEKGIIAGCATPLVVPASALSNPEDCASVPPLDRPRK